MRFIIIYGLQSSNNSNEESNLPRKGNRGNRKDRQKSHQLISPANPLQSETSLNFKIGTRTKPKILTIKDTIENCC